uniref:Tetratricopeptide repeat protein n=1 Tax=Fervidobacterium pennivorans TaxID=93466 RepID=A0A7V4NFJ3_FERPE
MTLLLAVSQRAIEYYSAAELSYKSGDYSTALKNYELALSTDPTIEGYDPQIKFKMGISAYMIGDYDKARSYLAGYDNDFVRALLDSISQRKAQDEWKKWISTYKPTTVEEATQLVSQVQKESKTNLLPVLLIFVITFAVLLVAEFRIYKARRMVIELPKKPAEATLSSSTGGQTVSETLVETSEKSVSEEFELIPKEARIVDFEQLLQSEIDVFKDIFEQIPQKEKTEQKPAEAKGVKELEKEPLVGAAEKEVEREKVVEEILGETKELIEDLGKEIVTQPQEEKFQVEQIEMESIEAGLLSRLRAQRDNWVEESQSSAEFYEEMQKEFSEFDTLEKITEEETKILVEKLIKLRQGENN